MKMASLDKDAFIESLPINMYNDLVNELNKDSAWVTLANHVAELLEYPCTLWIQSLADTKKPHESPGQKLLCELNIKMCTVEILRALLNECNLLNVLSIISDPEPLNIIVHPTEELQTNTLKIAFGQHLRLRCVAAGMPPPNYTWYHGDTQLQCCTSSELDIIITSASQAGEYRCKVVQITNDGTPVSALISKAVTVQVCPIPVEIKKQPQAVFEIKGGDSFTICCEADGYPEPCYQWFHDNTKLEGETSNILHIEKFTSDQEGKYYCYIRNDVSEVYTERTLVMMDHPRSKAVAKLALIITNGEYDHHDTLPTARNDGAHLANLLNELDFEVICLMNLTIAQMKRAIQLFSEALVDGVYGLFYFAGHGFKIQENYMLATDSPETYLRKDAVCENELLAELLKNDPKLLIVILDMCQTLPSKESNPEIYHELPTVHEYKSKKNLRNLIQAYSTSSYRPSYEKRKSKYGLYMTHLSKYINKDVTVTKIFEKVGKSFDSSFKGDKRNQIPMFASSVTKPFRLTDAIYKKALPVPVNRLYKMKSFSTQTLNITFKQVNLTTRIIISLLMEPYLNFIKIHVPDLHNVEIKFLNTVPAKRNNLYQIQDKNECWIHNPQMIEGPLNICILKNATLVGEILLHIKDYIPPLLEYIKC